jgi:hypothetical protein
MQFTIIWFFVKQIYARAKNWFLTYLQKNHS